VTARVEANFRSGSGVPLEPPVPVGYIHVTIKLDRINRHLPKERRNPSADANAQPMTRAKLLPIVTSLPTTDF
jgi:hypothetical protein